MAVNKAQGRTFSKVAVDLRIPKARMEADNFHSCYVALSRVRSRAGLTFIRQVEPFLLNAKPNSLLVQDAACFHQLEATTISDIDFYIAQQNAGGY